MVRTNWLQALSRFRVQPSRRQRRALQARRRRAGLSPVSVVQQLEDRTLLAAPNPLDLGALNGTNGFRLDGVAAYDNAGYSASSAGDVNGDGFEDVIVGAFVADPNGNSSGSSYVVFGRSGGFSSAVNLSSLDGSTGFRLDGVAAGDTAGYSLSDAGDVNGDGFGDLIIGADGADPFGESSAGTSYVVFGRSGGFASAINLGTLDGTDGFRILGVASDDLSGRSVSGAGDVNGDGYDELIIGAPGVDETGSDSGSSYVVFGRSSFSSVLDLFASGVVNGTTAFRLDGVAASDSSGSSVSGAGDVNGDGFGDLIIGANGADPFGEASAGSSYVVFGRSGGFASAINLSALNGNDGFRFLGVSAGDNSGWSVSSAGDVNGDGYDELIVGAPGADPNGSLSGSSYVVFGRSSFPSILDPYSPAVLNGTTAFRIDGVAADDRSGRSVHGAGDVDGDGFDDLIIGASTANPNGNTFAGSSYLLFGQSGAFASVINLSTLNGTTGFRLDGAAERDFSGRAVSGAGDVNGDGFDDLIVGAYGTDHNGAYSGSSYVVFGGEFTGGVETQVGGDGDDVLFANQGAGAVDVLIGGRGDDLLYSDGGDDVLRGGEGDDRFRMLDADFSGSRRIAGGTGVDTVHVDGVDVTLNLTAIPDNRITGIEEIRLSSAGKTTLSLQKLDVLNLSDSSNTLTVRGHGDDLVVVNETGWTSQGNVLLDGVTYEQFVKGAATLNIESGIPAMVGGVVSLSTLNGFSGFRLDGVAAEDHSGFSVGSAGDVNGDGFDDMIIGAFAADSGGNLNTGSSYVVFGRSGGFVSAIDLSSLNGTNGFRLDGVKFGDNSGFSVSSGGDVNGDGIDDLIIGARFADPNGSASGSSYVVFGRTWSFASAINLSILDGASGFRLDGVGVNDRSGFSVSSAGDVNGDGFDDLIVGAYSASPNGYTRAGSSFVVFGKSGGFTSVISLSTLDGTNGFRLDGAAERDESGTSVSRAGDFNGDGLDDLIVGAKEADLSLALTDVGATYVVFGRLSGFSSVINLSSLNGTNGFRLDGVTSFDSSGHSVSEAGDFNGDGLDDLLIGAASADPNGNSLSGSSYVVFGQSSGSASAINLSTLDGTTGFRLDGVDADDRSGRSVSGVGDVNGDGFDDLVIGAFLADPNGLNSGSSYVLFGNSDAFASTISLSMLDGANGLRLDGVTMYDGSGLAVRGAGDVDGDGFDDLIVGARGADPNGNSYAGSSYVVFGGNFTGGAETLVGGDGPNTLTATQGAGAVDVLIGGRGNDRLISDGGPDVLRGGEGDDVLEIPDVDFSGTRRLVGGTGFDTLRLNAPSPTLDLTAIPDNRIVDVEAIDVSALGSATLTLSYREVLNISDSSNTLTVFADNDTINMGAGWTQQQTEVDAEGFVYDVYTQGAATLRITHTQFLTLPPDVGSNDVTIEQSGGFVRIFDNSAPVVHKRVPIGLASSIVVNGAPGQNNRVVLDYASGGFFELPYGIRYNGTPGVTNELELLGSGATRATLTLPVGSFEAGTLTTWEGFSQTEITFSEILPLTATGLLTFQLDGDLFVGADTFSIDATTPLDLGSLTMLSGGSVVSTSPITVGLNESILGNGIVSGPLATGLGSFILADGNLTLGDASAFDGFFSDGRLQINEHTVTLLDANEAVLGSLTVLGSGGASGTLTAANGFLLEEGKNLIGQGTVNGEFHNDGDVSGGGTGIVFNDLVTGIGSANNVTYNGGFSPGHSPAEVFLRGTTSLAAANTLFIELGGLTPGGQFDRLSSTGTVNVDGTLDVSFINGFVPANGDSFEIIGASAVNGTFNTTNLPTLPLGLEWDVLYAPDSVTLDVFALATAVTDTAFNAPAPNPNRSGIGTLDVLFDLPVNVAGVTSLSLFNHTTGQPVNIATASLSGNGTPLVSWNLSGLTLPDGRYTAEVTTSQVTTTVGGPLASTYAIEFHVLRGDLDGDAIVNFNDTAPLSVNFGQTGAAYRPGDGDGDGLVNFNDTAPLSLNFGASLAPLTYDFGDAPETGTSFPTTLANDGARHVITGNSLFLGATRDAETDGQPDATASGDGLDEDGISVVPLVPGTNVAVTVTSSGIGFVNGWVDFNADGDWDDVGEQVFHDTPVVAGANNLQIMIPAGAALGGTFARFRLTGSGGYSYFGLAPSGEVEDYQLAVVDPAPDSSAAFGQEPSSIASETSVSRRVPPNRLFAIPAPAFATFDDPLVQFSTEQKSRLRGRGTR